MAISAYTDDGQLKKNPLLGTSLGTDYKQRKMRRAFGTIYDEAKNAAGAGGTQRDLTNKLTTRNNAASAINLNRLRDLSNQNDAMARNRNNLRDRGLEQGFANYQQGYSGLDAPTAGNYEDEWSARSGGREQVDQGNFGRSSQPPTQQQNRNRSLGNWQRKEIWDDAGGVKLVGNKALGGQLDFGGTTAAAVLAQIRSGRGFDPTTFGGGLGGYKFATGKSGKKYDDMGHYAKQEILRGLGLGAGAGDKHVRDNFAKWASELNAYNKKAYAMDKYGETYGNDKRNVYERRVKTGGAALDRQKARIRQEAPEVQQRMQDRAELYNMFA